MAARRNDRLKADRTRTEYAGQRRQVSGAGFTGSAWCVALAIALFILIVCGFVWTRGGPSDSLTAPVGGPKVSDIRQTRP